MNYFTPAIFFEELFADLHLSGLWEDGKLITDAIPRHSPEVILLQYRKEKNTRGFDLKAFFEANFRPSVVTSPAFTSDSSRSTSEHIDFLWNFLKREADLPIAGSSLIPLPYPYIVPGGRFNEIYYWDSYFTLLGLEVSGKYEVIQNMIDNFSWLIEQNGFIPNGNRTYFLSRSQPPFFVLMIEMLANIKGASVLLRYLPHLLKEHEFWMKGRTTALSTGAAAEHVVAIGHNLYLNRYFDHYPGPRSEMYRDDVELAKRTDRPAEDLFLGIRAACESGWDFSSRWLSNPRQLESIHTQTILPVDLNCLLWKLETVLAKAFELKNDVTNQEKYSALAGQRHKLILEYFWNEDTGYFHDFDFKVGRQTNTVSAAGMYPLFFHLATDHQAMRACQCLAETLLFEGGVVCTPVQSGQQWDAPNGWAPLQWVAALAAHNYGQYDLAVDIARRWTALNEKVYQRTGKMMEKYNVMDTDLASGGGEYPVQDGFGWTNGVYLKLRQYIEQSSLL